VLIDIWPIQSNQHAAILNKVADQTEFITIADYQIPVTRQILVPALALAFPLHTNKKPQEIPGALLF
jgi:hypothetical protein